jgi:glucosamine 6-phosphate synthetase-like amidotransferase/phosphosugar isomerase protein
MAKKINKKILELSSNEQNYEKGDFKHFMAKEIEEQPCNFKEQVLKSMWIILITTSIFIIFHGK